jgi:CheY-like chemotaxis protein
METAQKPRVLIADDQREVREALRLMLKAEGFDTETAGSPAEILQAVTSRDFNAVLMDLNYTRDTTCSPGCAPSTTPCPSW